LAFDAVFCQNCGASVERSLPPVAFGKFTSIKPSRPLGVTILAILSLISGVCLILLSGIMLTAGAVILGMTTVWGSLITTILQALAVVLALWGLLQLVIGWGLWNGKNWARLITIALAILGIITALILHSLSGIIVLAVSAIIIYYLLRPHVKTYFGKGIEPEPTEKTTSIVV